MPSPSVPLTGSGAEISRPILIAPARLGSGGLGAAAAEFGDGLTALGHEYAYVGPQPLDLLLRATRSRPYRRAFGMASHRLLTARAVRAAVPASGWDLAYAIPGTVPVETGSGVRVIYQATRHPAVEWAALRRGERETGGRGDMSKAELRRREREIAGADLIHVTSHAVQAEMLEAGVEPERLIHSYHGVDLERFRPSAKSEGLRIAFIGPLSLRKGVDVVAELAARLDDGVVEAVGGPTCPWSRRISEGARFARGTDVAETLGRSHVLVLPSRSDGFSFVVLEAMAAGTVPIVTPEVGASEIVRSLDPRLVIERADFPEATRDLLPRLDLKALSGAAALSPSASTAGGPHACWRRPYSPKRKACRRASRPWHQAHRRAHFAS